MTRLLLDGPLDGAANMARDRALLDVLEARIARGEAPEPVVRLYSWTRATVSTGRHQALEAACELDACLREGVGVVQRPTGGRAVLHDDEVTYAVIAPATGDFEGRGVERGSALIARGLALGLRRLGIGVETTRGVAASVPRHVREACFVSASRSELTHDGRKLAGSAQLKARAGLLQHGSVPLSFDHEKQARLLGTPAGVLRRHACGLDEALGRRPAPEDVRDALAFGLQEVLGAGRLSEPGEEELARQAELEAALRESPDRFRSGSAVGTRG